MTTKTEWNLFWITDFEAEEPYLSDMHAKGWQLKSIGLNQFYNFEQVEPADMVYRLDFKEGTRRDEASYRQIYQDYGWEYVTTCNNFSIFRKVPSADQEDQIYSDRESQYEMVKRIFRRRYLLLLGIYLLIFALMIGNEPSFVLGVSLTVLPLLIYLTWRFYQLKEKMKD